MITQWMSSTSGSLNLTERSRHILKQIVENYLSTGEPVGSRHLSRILPVALSPASIRNEMSCLEEAGLIYAPHTSAGRLPTETGLRFFVDAILEIGDVSQAERQHIETQIKAASRHQSFEAALTEASSLLSGLSRGAGVVVSHKVDVALKHIEFVPLDAGRALVILVSEDGTVENRILELPLGLPPSALVEASNYLVSRIRGKTLTDVRAQLLNEHKELEKELDNLTARLVEDGLAATVKTANGRQLIVRGQANLLEDLRAIEDLERVRLLFMDLETQTEVIDLLSRSETGEGVHIFIGSENKLFSLSGSSLVAAPFRDSNQQIIGVVGVIGPTRLNYARIVPMVDYTAQVMTKLFERG